MLYADALCVARHTHTHEPEFHPLFAAAAAFSRACPILVLSAVLCVLGISLFFGGACSDFVMQFAVVVYYFFYFLRHSRVLGSCSCRVCAAAEDLIRWGILL